MKKFALDNLRRELNELRERKDELLEGMWSEYGDKANDPKGGKGESKDKNCPSKLEKKQGAQSSSIKPDFYSAFKSQ